MDMVRKEKCVIWGMGNDYESILNPVRFEICKGNIEVVAIVCSKEDQYCKYRDGFPVISKEELLELDFDYVIISSTAFIKEIKEEAVKLGIGVDKIVNGQILRQPLFDFGLYSRLIKNPVTIISDDCWGGYVYHYLGLEFSSPLINTAWDKTEFSKFIQDPLFYLQTELTMVQEGDLRRGIWPIGRLGTAKKNVQIQFVHNVDFMEAEQQWIRRKKRMNQNNILVKMGFDISDQNAKTYIDAFENCKFRKVLFYNGDEDIEEKCKSKRFIWHETKGTRVEHFSYSDYMRANYMLIIDILKLLAGEGNYLRENE